MNDLFDNTELDARDRGMAVAAATHAKLLDWIRERMVELSRRVGEVTADDARPILEEAFELGLFERPKGKLNMLGSLFAGPGWVCVGFHRSRTRGPHGNLIRRWRYVGSN